MVDILIVEDNTELADLLQGFIEEAGYRCAQVSSGEEALGFIEAQDVGIVLLDIMLPGLDGFAVCDALHASKNIPVIVLSACTGKDDKLNALNRGADDYIEKPYDIDLLLAKITALYRRNRPDRLSQLTFGSLHIDTGARRVTQRGNPVTLNQKEYDLLCLLAKHANKTLRKERIFAEVWGDSFTEPSTVTVHIKWLREKVERDPKNPALIKTVWGVGYRFEYPEAGA